MDNELAHINSQLFEKIQGYPELSIEESLDLKVLLGECEAKGSCGVSRH